MDFFISDSHFYHDKIIRFAGRPFRNVEQMNNAMVENWNRRVGQHDTVYHLGDIGFFRSAQRMQDTVSALNGRKILIKGNHDKFTNTQYKMAGFEEVHKYNYRYPVYDELQQVAFWLTLQHKPAIFSDGITLCGHIHQQFYFQGNNLNMSVEVWGYQPVTLQEIQDRIKWLKENVYDTYTEMKIFGKKSNFDDVITPPIPGE